MTHVSILMTAEKHRKSEVLMILHTYGYDGKMFVFLSRTLAIPQYKNIQANGILAIWHL